MLIRRSLVSRNQKQIANLFIPVRKQLMSSTAIAKWDDSRLWDNFPADPTRREAAVERVVFNANRRQQIKPINARCSLASKTSVVEEEKIEIEADEEPSRCSNLILCYYQQLKKMSKITK